MERFTRIRQLLGDTCLDTLHNSTVTIVGLGAVGGYAMEGLARAGIGSLKLIDFDIIQPSNINRQILALESTLGKPKTAVAKERVLEINPRCKVDAQTLFASDETVETILSPVPDLLIDAIDSLNPKAQLLTAAYRSNIKTLSSMGAALRTDPSRITIADLYKTKACPLARRLRQRLRRQDVGEGITCVFSTEPVDFAYQPPKTDEAPKSVTGNKGRARRVLGSLPTLTAIFGMYLANQAILDLINKEK